MELDLTALEAGRKSTGRSSQFNPRLKPRARPTSSIGRPLGTRGARMNPLRQLWRLHLAQKLGTVLRLRIRDALRLVRFASAAAAAARPRARPHQQQPAAEPAASPSSGAAAASPTAADEEQEWPDASPVLELTEQHHTQAAAKLRSMAADRGRGPGRGRPPGHSAGASARTVASQRKAAAAAAVRGAARPAPSVGSASPAKRSMPMPLVMLPPAQRQRGVGHGRMPVVPMNLDVQRMSLKDVIRWSNSKERETLLAEKRRKELLRQQQAEAGGSPASPAAQAAPRVQSPPPTSAMAPQVSIVDGQIVVDTATLTVQAQPEDRQRTVVEDTQQLNSQSYAVNRTPSDRWQPDETENFYRALATFGSDFTLIASLFPGKNRRQIKNKYSKECKVNATRIDEALKGRACSTTAYEDVISRITYDADNTEMLEVDDPPPAD